MCFCIWMYFRVIVEGICMCIDACWSFAICLLIHNISSDIHVYNTIVTLVLSLVCLYKTTSNQILLIYSFMRYWCSQVCPTRSKPKKALKTKFSNKVLHLTRRSKRVRQKRSPTSLLMLEQKSSNKVLKFEKIGCLVGHTLNASLKAGWRPLWIFW